MSILKGEIVDVPTLTMKTLTNEISELKKVNKALNYDVEAMKINYEVSQELKEDYKKRGEQWMKMSHELEDEHDRQMKKWEKEKSDLQEKLETANIPFFFLNALKRLRFRKTKLELDNEKLQENSKKFEEDLIIANQKVKNLSDYADKADKENDDLLDENENLKRKWHMEGMQNASPRKNIRFS